MFSRKRSSLAESSASHRFISILQFCILRINHDVARLWRSRVRLPVFVISCILRNVNSFEILKTALAKQTNWSRNGIFFLKKGWLEWRKWVMEANQTKKEKWELYILKHCIENPRAAMKNRQTGQCFALTSQLFHLKRLGSERDWCLFFFLVLKVFHDWSAFHLWSSISPPHPALLL